jgi:hypothetical protein
LASRTVRHDRRHEREESVLELYHNINSVCAQKVRIALKQKGQEAKDHILTLRGDQNEPGISSSTRTASFRRWSMTALRSWSRR